MTPKSFDLLSDTDEHAAVDEERTPPVTTKTLAEMAESPASELFVRQELAGHVRACWAKRWIRRFRIVLAFGFGAFCAIQIGGFWIIRSMLRDLDLRTADTVERVLRSHKLISLGEHPQSRGLIGQSTGGGGWTLISEAQASSEREEP